MVHLYGESSNFLIKIQCFFPHPSLRSIDSKIIEDNALLFLIIVLLCKQESFSVVFFCLDKLSSIICNHSKDSEEFTPMRRSGEIQSFPCIRICLLVETSFRCNPSKIRKQFASLFQCASLTSKS